MTDAWRWQIEAAPSDREALEAFFVWVYTPRAHDDGTVDQIIQEALAFPHHSRPRRSGDSSTRGCAVGDGSITDSLPVGAAQRAVGELLVAPTYQQRTAPSPTKG
jgi:hypothetical protein